MACILQLRLVMETTRRHPPFQVILRTGEVPDLLLVVIIYSFHHFYYSARIVLVVFQR